MTISKINTNSLADQGVTSPKAETLMQPIGVGQTWQDVTASRAVGTTYTNSTGRPIGLYAVSASSAWGLVINGTTLVAGGTYTSQVVMAMTIPAGATYSLTSGTLGKWLELR
jgi:hypothetical protein